jgi:hypothetical protein
MKLYSTATIVLFLTGFVSQVTAVFHLFTINDIAYACGWTDDQTECNCVLGAAREQLSTNDMTNENFTVPSLCASGQLDFYHQQTGNTMLYYNHNGDGDALGQCTSYYLERTCQVGGANVVWYDYWVCTGICGV